MASFQDNLGKPLPECQTILDFAAAKDDGGGDGDSCNSEYMQSSSQISIVLLQAWAVLRILKWGYKTGFASVVGEKKNFCTPTFPNVGVQASKYQ